MRILIELPQTANNYGITAATRLIIDAALLIIAAAIKTSWNRVTSQTVGSLILIETRRFETPR
jgi:hypothetical protein